MQSLGFVISHHNIKLNMICPTILPSTIDDRYPQIPRAVNLLLPRYSLFILFAISIATPLITISSSKPGPRCTRPETSKVAILVKENLVPSSRASPSPSALRSCQVLPTALSCCHVSGPALLWNCQQSVERFWGFNTTAAHPNSRSSLPLCEKVADPIWLSSADELVLAARLKRTCGLELNAPPLLQLTM